MAPFWERESLAAEASALPNQSDSDVSQRYQMTKRVVDVALGAVLLLISLPLLLAVAVLIRLDSPGPALFRQRRVGEGGQEFVMFKFRSMYHNADDSIHRRAVAERLARNGGGEAGSGDVRDALPFIGLPDDPRITRVGRLLRRTNLDELPQLVNVLKGDMSLVGPRPAIGYEVDLYEDWQRARLKARPGMTGLWQVKGRGAATFEEMVRLDLQYLRERGLVLDMRILALTLPMLMLHRAGRGA